jgi:molecular chaperone GrpE (heat shock protein)
MMTRFLARIGLVRQGQLDALIAELTRARAEAEAARTQIARTQAAQTRVNAQTADQAVQTPPAIAGELIMLADRLVDLTGQGAPVDAEQAGAVLGWLAGRTQAMLDACEVTAITDDGPVDLMWHEVVAGRPTSTAELAEHIASTIRPGYAWRGRLVRPQQVVAYIFTEETP